MKDGRELEEAVEEADLALLHAESAIQELVKTNEALKDHVVSLRSQNAKLQSDIDASHQSLQRMSSAELKLTKKFIENLQMDSKVKSLLIELKQEQQQTSSLRREVILLRGEVARLERQYGKNSRY